MKNNMNFISDDNNIIANECKNRYNSLSDEKKKKIDEMKKNGFNNYQLRLIKRKRTEIREGDVFVLSPRKEIYFYGKVLKTHIQHLDSNDFIYDKNVVFIFECKTKELSIKDFKANYNQLLIRPAIVDKSYWTQGLFYTVGNIPITDEEKNLDYGFYDVLYGKFFKENGIEMNKIPKYYGVYGITTIIGIAMKIQQRLIIDPGLLEF